MRRIESGILICVICLSAIAASADDYAKGSSSDIAIPPGMELRKSGDVNVLVPKGAVLHKVNDVLVLESAEEYSARRFEDMEKRMNNIEDRLNAMHKVE